MVLFRLNQVPDRLYTKFLDLVGIEPFPPSVARGDLTFWLSAVLDHAVTVPAGTEVATCRCRPDGTRSCSPPPRTWSSRRRELFAAKTGKAGRRPAAHRRLGRPALRRWRGRCASPPTRSAPGDARLLGFQDTLAGNLLRLSISRSDRGHRGRPARPADGLGGVGGRERGCEHDARRTPPVGSTATATIVLLVPLAHGTAVARADAGLLAAGPAALDPGRASPPTRRPPGSPRCGWTPGRHRRRPSTPRSSAPRPSGAATGPGSVVHRRPARPVLPRREGERHPDHRRRDAGRPTGTEVADFTQSGPQSTATTCSTAASGDGQLRARRCVIADGSTRQHGRHPTRRRRDRHAPVPPRRRRGGQRRRGHPDRACARASPTSTGCPTWPRPSVEWTPRRLATPRCGAR